MTEEKVHESGTVTIDQWKDQVWAEGQIGFHQEVVTPSLVKWWSHTVSQLPPDCRDAVSVLVPLCGASRDLAWLLARPEVSVVCGIEISELALQRLLSENPQLGDDPSRRRSVGPGVDCWESSDGRLKFYLGDLFSDSLLSELKSSCQVVWDRGSLVAIDVSDREKYIGRLRELSQPKHALLVESIEYDLGQYGGPPHSISAKCMHSLFDANYSVQQLESIESPEKAAEYKVRNYCKPMYLLLN